MEMFDYIEVAPEFLPGQYRKFTSGQTKSFDNVKQTYNITSRGTLERGSVPEVTTLEYHGDLRFTMIANEKDSTPSQCRKFIARFTDGQLEYIDIVDDEPMAATK